MKGLAEALTRLTAAAQGTDAGAFAADALQIAADLLPHRAWALFEETDNRWTRLAGQATTGGEPKGILQELQKLTGLERWEQVAAESGHSKLVLVSGSNRAADEDVRAVLQALVTTTALGFDRVHLHEDYHQTELDRPLAQLGEAITDLMDLPAIFRLAAQVAAKVSKADDTFVLQRGEGREGSSLFLRACLHDLIGEPITDSAHAVLAVATELSLRAVRQHTVVEERTPTATIAAVPMYRGDRPIGCVVAVRLKKDGSAPHPFEPLRLMRLQVVANHLATALQSALLEAEQKRRVRELLLLNEVARDCAKLGLDQLMPAVTERLCRSLPVDVAGLLFLDQEREELFFGGGFSLFGAIPSHRIRFPTRSKGLAGKVVASRQPRRSGIEEVETPELRQYANTYGLTQFGAVPMMVKDRVIGLITVAGRGRGLSDEDLRLLAAIAAEVAVAVENSLLYSEAQRHAADLSRVQSIGEVMARSLEPSSVVREAGQRLADALECDCVHVHTREDGGFVSLWQQGVPDSLFALTRHRSPDDPIASRALRSTSPVAFAQSEISGPMRDAFAEHGYQQFAVAPMLVAEERAGTQQLVMTGLIVVGRRASRPFTDSDQRVLGSVATQLAVALRNAQLFEQTKQRADELSIIAEAGRALLGGTSLEEALSVVVERVARLVNVRGCCILLNDQGADHLRFVANYPASINLSEIRIPLSTDSVVARSFREQEPKVDRNLRHHPSRHTWPASTEFVAEWALALPLVSGEQTVGVFLLFDSDKERVLSQEELDRVMAVGNQVAIAIERSRLNTRLIHAQAQLVQKERLAALGQMAAHVAHEVRNPLGVIVNSLGTLARFVELTGDAKRVYEMMRQEAGRLDRIVSDMLDYTRPTEPRLVPASLNRVLRDALTSAAAAERTRNPAVDNIQLSLEVSSGLPMVPMDDRLMHQALVNLLTNAFQSLGKAGRIEVGGRLSEDGRFAEISVADDGLGISPDVKARMFEPFYTTRAKGSGLGLAIVKRIVDDHNGEILVESEPGQGTRFVLRIPTVATLSSAVAQRRVEPSAREDI